MLARRKRQPEEEEESLVPHGLIWQATENDMPPQPETAKSAAQPEASKTTPGLDPSSSAGSRPNATTPKAKLGAISPPLPWPSPKIQEIARPGRPKSSAASPAKKSSPISLPVRNLDPEAVRTEGDTPEESDSRTSFLVRLRAERDRITQVFGRTRQHASRGLLSTKAAFGKLEARVANTYQLSKLRRQIREVEKMAGQRAGVPEVDPTPSAGAEQFRRARERAFSLFASIPGATERALSHTRLACGRALAITRDSLHKAAESARAFRITIKLRRSQSPTLEGWLARAKDVRLRLMQPDSRLWTSMAMATMSAVLALLVVSGVRGYSPDTPPATVSRNGSPPPVLQPAASAVTNPSPATRPLSSKPAPTVVKPASLSAPARKAAAPKVTHKRIHHQADDDYVAKDTYVYYGLHGKSGR